MSYYDDRLLISQKKLSLLLGGLAIAMPDILYLGNLWVYDVENRLASLSGYYYTEMRDFFVGILFSIGMFLITYEGYEIKDRIFATFAGFLSVVIAVVPTHPPGTIPGITSDIHNYAAALFYGILTYMCMYRFTLTDKSPTTQKKIRNVIYLICGITMIVSLISLIILSLFNIRPFSNPIFWLEYAANTAFGIAFVVKGEGIFFLNDDPIVEMTPWEIYGIGILVILIIGNLLVFTNIFIF